MCWDSEVILTFFIFFAFLSNQMVDQVYVSLGHVKLFLIMVF